MTVEYKWTISQLERKLPSEFINIAHWQCTGIDGDLSSSVYATCSFEGEISTPYADVTHDQVLGWVWELVDKAATESAIAARIEELKNPVVASGTPW